MRRATRRKLWSAVLVAVAVLGYRFFLRDLGGRFGLGEPALPDKGDRLRVVNWNIHNFPDHDGHARLLQDRLARMDADVLVFQEVGEAEALQSILPGWTVVASKGGGRRGQHLAIAFDPRVVELLDGPHENNHLSLEGRLRPALHTYLRAQPAGPDFHLVVVHLKAFPEGYTQREVQWKLLANMVPSLQAEDPDVLLVGDFNTTGSAEGRSAIEVQSIARHLPAFRRLPPNLDCTAYWDGARRDAWKEASTLDHIWVADLSESLTESAQTTVIGPCARHACQPFRSTETYPDVDYANVSDHCPLIVDLARSDDDVMADAAAGP